MKYASSRTAISSDAQFAWSLYCETAAPVISKIANWDAIVEWHNFNENWKRTSNFIVEVDGQPIAWFAIDEKPNITNIDQLFVAPAFQRSGLGSGILMYLRDLYQKNGEIRISILHESPLMSVAERAGFIVLARRSLTTDFSLT